MILRKVKPAEGPIEMFGVLYWRHCVELSDGRHGHLWIELTDEEMWTEQFTLGPLPMPLDDVQGVEELLPKIDAVRHNKFDRMWQMLADRGQCDSLGGAEYRRILTDWIKAGFPTPISDHIRKHANGIPHAPSCSTSPRSSTAGGGEGVTSEA